MSVPICSNAGAGSSATARAAARESGKRVFAERQEREQWRDRVVEFFDSDGLARRKDPRHRIRDGKHAERDDERGDSGSRHDEAAEKPRPAGQE